MKQVSMAVSERGAFERPSLLARLIALLTGTRRPTGMADDPAFQPYRQLARQLLADFPCADGGRIVFAAGVDGLPTDTLLTALSDRSIAEERALPSTGISQDWEQRLSAAFIGAPGYGTRASTVLLMEHDGEVHFRERSFGEYGEMIGDRRFRFSPAQVPVSTAT